MILEDTDLLKAPLLSTNLVMSLVIRATMQDVVVFAPWP